MAWAVLGWAWWSCRALPTPKIPWFCGYYSHSSCGCVRHRGQLNPWGVCTKFPGRWRFPPQHIQEALRTAWFCSVLLKHENFDLELFKSEMMPWFQYQLFYPVKFHVLVIFNEEESKTKANKKGDRMTWADDFIFPCQEDVVKILNSRLPMDVPSLLCYLSVGKGSRVLWCIVTSSWTLQGQATNTRIP